MGFAQKAKIPLTAVSGWFQIFSTVKVLDTWRIPPTAVGGLFRSFLIGQHCDFAPLSPLQEVREDLNHPPTAVNGISPTLRVRS